jgi:hypothetical protein
MAVGTALRTSTPSKSVRVRKEVTATPAPMVARKVWPAKTATKATSTQLLKKREPPQQHNANTPPPQPPPLDLFSPSPSSLLLFSLLILRTTIHRPITSSS